MKRIELRNSLGMEATLIESGASLVSLKVPSTERKLVDVVLGLRKIEGYSSVSDNASFIGCVVGRNCNRMRNAKFSLNEEIYNVSKNIPPHHLHGIYSFIAWKVVKQAENSVTFSHFSIDGEEGYPCDLYCEITFTLADKKNEIIIDYEYTNKDKNRSTICNLTNHTYFNLNGVSKPIKDTTNHLLKLRSDKVTKMDSASIPTGELGDVSNTIYDFRKLRMIGKTDYDINYAISRGEEVGMVEVAELSSPVTGIRMTLKTTSLGCQLYNSVFLKGVKGKYDVEYNKYDGLCLETQYFPNAMNIDEFESPVVLAGECKKCSTSFEFTLIK